MVRTFLQVAAGAADIPVTRLLGQSPAGLSATGDSDTRNYYDMIAARQELDLRPQLERLDALLLRGAGVDPGAVRFAFRPLWQLSAAERAQVSLQKAQATAAYAGLSLWPAAVTGALVRSQLLEDGVYPGAAAIFGSVDAEQGAAAPEVAPSPVADFDPAQPRDPDGRWSGGGTSPDGSARSPGPEPSAPAASHPSAKTEKGDDQQKTELTNLIRAAIGPIMAVSAVRQLLTSALGRMVSLFGNKPSEPSKSKENPSGHSSSANAKSPEPPERESSTSPGGQTPQAVLRGFAGPKSMRTWQNQMTKRGWTAQQIEDAVERGRSFPAETGLILATVPHAMFKERPVGTW